jgi:hypothetical protein
MSHHHDRSEIMEETGHRRVLAFGQVGGHAGVIGAEGDRPRINGLAMGPTRFLRTPGDRPPHRNWHGGLDMAKRPVLRRRPMLNWVAPRVDARPASGQVHRFRLEDAEPALILAAPAKGDAGRRALAALAVASAGHDGSDLTASIAAAPHFFLRCRRRAQWRSASVFPSGHSDSPARRRRPAFVRARPMFGEIVERFRPLPSLEPSSNEPTPGPALPADAAIQRPRAGFPRRPAGFIDRPDSSTGRRFDHGHDADPHRVGQAGPGGLDDSGGIHSRDREGVSSGPSGAPADASMRRDSVSQEGLPSTD